MVESGATSMPSRVRNSRVKRVARDDGVVDAVQLQGSADDEIAMRQRRARRSVHRLVALEQAALGQTAVVRLRLAHVRGAVLEVEAEDAPADAVAAVDGGLDEKRLEIERLAVERDPRGDRAPGAEVHRPQRRDRGRAGGRRGRVLRVHAHVELPRLHQGDRLGRHRARLRLDARKVSHARGRAARGVGLVGEARDADAAVRVVQRLGDHLRGGLGARGRAREGVSARGEPTRKKRGETR